MKNKKEIALNIINDLVINYFVYDRKEDKDLSSEDLWNLLESRELTIDEIVLRFRQEINEFLLNNL